MATMEEVAQKAGVSTTTVSHVINKTRFVKEETKSKVIKAMDDLKYQPNFAARSLRSQRSNIIGLMMPDISNSFFMTLVKGVESVLRKNGYSLVLCNSDDNLEIEKDHLKVFNTQLVDGLIMRTTADDHSFLGEYIKNYPAIFVDCKPRGFQGDGCVLVDNVVGAYQAVNFLLERGHRKIGIIAGIAGLTSSEERLQGYLNALRDHGVESDNLLIKYSDSRSDDGYKLCRELIENTDVTALFTGNNLITIGAMRFLREKKIKIPDELALIGFDDREWALIIDPPLTVISQPSYKMGEKAAELLLEKINNKSDEFKEYKLPTELIVRESC
jgi:LacI family transcriptional regulator